MAQMNPRITVDVIEANEFPALSQQFQVMSVPKTVVNGIEEFVGALPEAQWLAAIRAAIGKPAPPE